MTDTTTYPSANDIIASIKVRLGELDLEIQDAKKNLKEPRNFSKSCYQEGVLLRYWKTLTKEKETLEKIMRGEYGRKEFEDADAWHKLAEEDIKYMKGEIEDEDEMHLDKLKLTPEIVDKILENAK